MMIRVSIKLIVGGFIFVTALFGLACVTAPLALSIQDDATVLVFSAVTSATEDIQAQNSRQQWKMQLACTILQHAGTTRNFLDGNIWDFMDWGALVLSHVGRADITIASADGYAVRISTIDTSGLNMAPRSGYVFVTNSTSPGHFVDVGLFEWHTHSPANATSPWTRVNTTTQWVSLPSSKWLMSRNTTLTWSPIVAAPTTTFGDYEAKLVYGGLMHPSTRYAQQYIAIGAHGKSLAQYFRSLSASNKVHFMMVDTVTSAFIAGSFGDGSTRRVANLTTIMLPKLSDVQHPLIAPILSATVVVGGEIFSGAQAFLTCDMPCAFVYWPHNGLLHNNGKNSDVAQIEGLIGALMYSFIVIRVGEAGHHPNGSAMQLRLIVVLPSDDVIGTLVEYVVHTIIYSHVAMVIFCVVLTAASAAVIFRDLTNVEKHLKYLSMFPAQLASLPLPPNVSYDLALAHLLTSSWIAEFDHLHQLMRKLARELSTLRSFSSSALLLAAANSHHGEGELQGVSCDAALDDVHLAKPYQMIQGNLWSVPVTTLYARIHEDFLGAGPRADPLRVFQRHGSIFSVLHRQISKIRGGTIACMYGDRIVMHFNAMDRTKHHVTAALAFISNCQTEIEFINGSESMSPPHASQQTFCHESRKEQQSTAKSRRPNIMFGVASSLARCGFLGPSQMKTFTVVSTSLAQASFMCRIAASHQSAVVATWRVAELATQQPHSRESCTVSFVSIALAVLPGEQDGGQTSVYEVRSLRTQKLLK